MNPIDKLFQSLRTQGRKAFIPFLTAGDPDLDMTTRLVNEVTAQGASLIEIGFPYSDPIADGPVIQASYTRALAGGLHIDDVFAWAHRIARQGDKETGRQGERHTGPSSSSPCLIGMVSYSVVHRRGAERFLAQSQASGFSGIIVPDLPVEESGKLAQMAADRDFKLIMLVTPTTPRERAVQIAGASTGFVYYVSVTGITGTRDRLPDELLGQIAWLRGQTDLPICVGFGISTPEHVRMLREVVDGIIVGSALVRHLENVDIRPAEDTVQAVGRLCRSLAEALNPA